MADLYNIALGHIEALYLIRIVRVRIVNISSLDVDIRRRSVLQKHNGLDVRRLVCLTVCLFRELHSFRHLDNEKVVYRRVIINDVSRLDREI